MAKTNKYTSINFNDIYEKKLNTTSPSTATATTTATGKYPISPSTTHKSYSVSASSRSHGMLVLSRSSPKPISQPQSQSQNLPPISPKPQPPPPLTDHDTRFEPDAISLRPLGKTGSGPLLPSPPSQFTVPEKEEGEAVSTTATPKSDKFVPPHLRPGFVAKKDERQAPSTAGGFRPAGAGGFVSSPTRYGEDRRPKSGGGYERVTGRRGYAYLGEVNRPRSSGTQRSSSG